MEPPAFLPFEFVVEIHEQSLVSYGGAAGIRDQGLIESALASAQNTFFYGSGDLFDVAAAYAFHIAEAQAFFDGNKRTAIGSAIAFLAGCGFRPAGTEELQFALYEAMIAIAEKRLDKAGLAAVFRERFA